MDEIELSAHAREMLKERRIPEEWVRRTIEAPDRSGMSFTDYNMHYTKAIRERKGQVLHVVVNPNVHPNRVVTVFFDRRFGLQK